MVSVLKKDGVAALPVKRAGVTKADVMKCKGGTWLEFWWNGSPNTVGLLLERPERTRGDVTLFVFWPHLHTSDRHAVHEQVVRIIGPVEAPRDRQPVPEGSVLLKDCSNSKLSIALMDYIGYSHDNNVPQDLTTRKKTIDFLKSRGFTHIMYGVAYPQG